MQFQMEDEAHQQQQQQQQQDKEEALPEAFLCPITQEKMVDPVIAQDGHSYSRTAIRDWFRQGRLSSPYTNERLASDQLLPNHSLRKAIEQLRPTQRPTADAFASDVREGPESPTLARRLKDQEVITEELTQENARLHGQVEDIRRQFFLREDFNMTVLRQHNHLATVLVAISAVLFAYDVVPFIVPAVALMVTSVTVLRLAYGGGHSFGINPHGYFYTVQSEEYKREVIAFISLLFVALGSNKGSTILREMLDFYFDFLLNKSYVWSIFRTSLVYSMMVCFDCFLLVLNLSLFCFCCVIGCYIIWFMVCSVYHAGIFCLSAVIFFFKFVLNLSLFCFSCVIGCYIIGFMVFSVYHAGIFCLSLLSQRAKGYLCIIVIISKMAWR